MIVYVCPECGGVNEHTLFACDGHAEPLEVVPRPLADELLCALVARPGWESAPDAIDAIARYREVTRMPRVVVDPDNPSNEAEV